MFRNRGAKERDPLALQNQVVGRHHLSQIQSHLGGKSSAFAQLETALMDIVPLFQQEEVFFCKCLQRNGRTAVAGLSTGQESLERIAVLLQLFVDRIAGRDC